MKKFRKNLIIYCLFFVLVYVLSFVIILKPSSSLIVNFKFINVNLILLLIYSFYPFYLVSLYSVTTHFDKEDNLKYILFLTLIINILVVLANFVFIALEAKNFANYVYSTFHIFLPAYNTFSNIQIFSIVLAIVILPGRFNIINIIKTYRSKGVQKIITNPTIFVLAILAIMITNYITTYIKMGIYEASLFSKWYKSNIEYRIRTVDLWNVANKMDFVIKNTPNDSIILIPSQTWDFPEIGNQVLARYYLYPRTLVSPERIEVFKSDIKGTSDCSIYYLFGEKGLKPNEYFPENDFFSSYILTKLKNGEVKEFKNIQYDKKFRDNIKDLEIGIIKLPKCGF